MALGKGIKQFIKTVTSKEAKKRNKEGVIGDKLDPSFKSEQIQKQIDFEKFDKAVKKDIKKALERQELQSFTREYVEKVIKPQLKNSPKKMKRGGVVKSSVRKPVKRRSSGVALRGYGKEIK